MTKFFEAPGNIFRIPDLRKRVLFTLALLAVYRIGAYIPTPGIDTQRFAEFFTRNAAGGFLGYLDLFSGGMMRRMTIFALGITPYITASIILQLLTVVIPTLDKLQKEGELGRRKITVYALSDHCPLHPPVARHRLRLAKLKRQLCDASRLGLCLHDRAHLYCRIGLRHVARRADYRPRHRQRHVANHFRRLHHRLAQRRREHLPEHLCHPPVAGAPNGGDPGRHGGRRRVYRTGRTRRTPHPRAVCQTRHWPPYDGRSVHSSALESERRRRDPDHLCGLAAGHSANHPAASRRQKQRLAEQHARQPQRREPPLLPGLYRPDSLLLLLLRLHHLQPE